MKYTLFIFFIILLLGCGKDNIKITEEPQLIWSTPLKKDTLAGTMLPILYDNIVLHTERSLGSYYAPITAFDKNTGEQLWEWSNYFSEFESFYGISPSTIIRHNIFVFSTGKGVYAINVSTGQTLWRTRDENLSGGKSITNYGDLIFHVELQPDRSEYYLKVADIYTGNWQTIYTTKEKDDFIPSLRPPACYIDTNGDTILLFTNNRYNFELQKGNPELICYNLTKKEEVYKIETTPLNPGYGIVREPLIYNDKAYLHVGPFMYCYDVVTGQLVWSKRLRDIVGSISFIIAGERLFVGIEGTSPLLYALNPDNGYHLWQIESSGTSSKMQYHNGIIYFNGGGNGLLHAVNAQTGEYIWQYESPDLVHHSGACFDNAITVDKETGRIYTANYLNALCFEAM